MSGGGTFMDALAMELSNRGMPAQQGSWMLGQLAQSIISFSSPPSPTFPPPPITNVDPSALHLVPDHVMIHAMLERGFAVMKIPEGGALSGLVKS